MAEKKRDLELTEFRVVMNVLKKALRMRGLSYRDLAEHMGLSESGVKKIFTANDCSFHRLTQIAQALDLRISDVFAELDHSEFKSTHFTEAQQVFFLKHRDAFVFYFKLVILRMDLSEIQKELKLTNATKFKYLRKLDELNMIRLLPGDKVKLPPISMIRDFGSGPLLTQLYQEWGMAMVQQFADPRFQASGKFIIRCLRMKDETYQDFLSRLQELENEFLRRSVREMSMAPSRLKSMRWISLTDSSSFV